MIATFFTFSLEWSQWVWHALSKDNLHCVGCEYKDRSRNNVHCARCEYKDRRQKSCYIVVKIVNFFTYVFSWHLKVMLIISSCVRWLIWMLRNSSLKFIKLKFGFWFKKRMFELEYWDQFYKGLGKGPL
jgi:hypothetical protein